MLFAIHNVNMTSHTAALQYFSLFVLFFIMDCAIFKILQKNNIKTRNYKKFKLIAAIVGSGCDEQLYETSAHSDWEIIKPAF